jgi:ribosomal protein L37E
MSFSRPKRLRQHEWQTHKIGEPMEDSNLRFPCTQCGITFTRTANLRRHQMAVCRGSGKREGV